MPATKKKLGWTIPHLHINLTISSQRLYLAESFVMSILATLPTSKWIIPQETIFMKIVPAAFTPMMSMVHATTTLYTPMFFRLFLSNGGGSTRYNNLTPREQIAKILASHPNSLFSRLHYAHVNGIEVTPFFLAAMCCGIAADVDESRLSKYGTLFVALRVAYTIMYVIQSRSTSMFRSLLFLWSLAMSMNLIRESSAKMYD